MAMSDPLDPQPSSVALAPEAAEDLTIIRENTRETLELVRSLVGMLLPKDDGDGPKFEELIAALVAQQRDILIAIRQMQSDIQALARQGRDRHPDGDEIGTLKGSAHA